MREVASRLLLPVGVVAALVGVGWILTATVWSGSSLATPPEMVAQAAKDGGDFYLRHTLPTLARAGSGYLLGNTIGILLAIAVLAISRSETVIVPLAVISQCLPLTAIGPLILIVFGAQATSVVLSALLTFFPTLVSTIVGGRRLSPTVIDVGRSARARWTDILALRLHAATPSIASALAVAVPAAMLGAILGEYFGGLSTGLGVALHAAQYQMMPARMWTLALVVGSITIIGYGLVVAAGRPFTRWSVAGRSQ